MPTVSSESEHDKWQSVPQTTSFTYSSLSGIPIPDLPFRDRLNKLIETSYFALKCSLDKGSTINNCSIGTTRVECNILCQDSSCSVHRMRRSQVERMPSTTTPLNSLDGGDSWVTLNNIIALSPFAAGPTHVSNLNPAENFLSGNSTLYTSDDYYGAGYDKLTSGGFSYRLTALFNTCWQLSLAPYSIASNKYSLHGNFKGPYDQSRPVRPTTEPENHGP